MSGIAAANLGITVGVQSDVVIIQSDVKAINSDIKVLDPIIDTIKSDIIVDQPKITTIRSDLIVSQSDIKTLQSDLTKTRSDMLITHSDVKAINSDVKVLDPIIDTIKSDLIVVQPKITAILSDTVVLTARTTVVSTASATTAGVIIQDTTTGTPTYINITTGAVANTFTAWNTLDASASANSWISHITVNSLGHAYANCIEIATGAAASEVSIIRFSWSAASGGSAPHTETVIFPLPIPIKVASGTRIAARVSSEAAYTQVFTISLSMYQSLET